MVRFCPNCGTEVDDTAVFCPTCGQAIDQDARPRCRGPGVAGAGSARAPAAGETAAPAPNWQRRHTSRRVEPSLGDDRPRRASTQPPAAARAPARQPDRRRPCTASRRTPAGASDAGSRLPPFTLPVMLSGWLIGGGALVGALGRWSSASSTGREPGRPARARRRCSSSRPPSSSSASCPPSRTCAW